MTNSLSIELPTPPSCFFCDRTAGGTGASVIFEDALVIARVNGRQFQPGQVLVIPRRHAPTLFDLTDDEAVAITHAVRRLGEAVLRAFDAEGLLVYQNNGRLSGQEVPHYHMHLVPMYRETSPWGNGPRHIAEAKGRPFVPNRPIELTESERRAVAERIRAALPGPRDATDTRPKQLKGKGALKTLLAERAADREREG